MRPDVPSWYSMVGFEGISSNAPVQIASELDVKKGQVFKGRGTFR